MIVRNSRAITATILAGVVTAAGFFTVAPVAQAHPVASGTFTMTGDPGDPITGGATYSYDVAAGDRMSIHHGDQHYVALSIAGANGDTWSMALTAPTGQQLAVGSYPNATNLPNSTGGAGVDVFTGGRGCYTTAEGSFVIADVSFGPGDYVERLDATFEMHCVGAEPALRGRVVIGNPPPPTPLEFTLTTAAEGVFSKLNGTATVHGTVECNADTTVGIHGQVTQVKKRVIIRGRFYGEVDCVAGETAQWSGTADSTDATPFQKGKVDVTGSAGATDPYYDGEIWVELVPTTVTLTRARPVVEARM
jgi:hypothetical protein